MRFEKCGAPLPWGTTCTRDRDHNDHADGLSPRWHSGLDDIAERDARIASLEAVVEAARGLYAVTGPWSEEYEALRVALKALGGEVDG
jgi:hypothetical protein